MAMSMKGSLMLSRLVANWVYGGFLASFVLLGLTVIAAPFMGAALACVMLQLPVYMIHQLEEHDGDRFRRFINARLGGGRDVLTPLAVFVINIGGIWALYLLSIGLAARVDLGLGLIAIYGTLVNGIVHLAAAVAMRGYNPGLATAVLLLLPVAIAGLWLVAATGEASIADHAIGLIVAFGLHAAIIAHVRIRRRRLAG